MKDEIQIRVQEFRTGVYALRKRRGLWFRGQVIEGSAQGVSPSRDTDCFGMGLLRERVNLPQSGIYTSGSVLGKDSIPMRLP